MIKKNNGRWLVWTMGVVCLSACGPDDDDTGDAPSSEQQGLFTCGSETTRQQCQRYLLSIKEKMKDKNKTFGEIDDACVQQGTISDDYKTSFKEACDASISRFFFGGKVRKNACSKDYLVDYCSSFRASAGTDLTQGSVDILHGINQAVLLETYFMVTCLALEPDGSSLRDFMKERVDNKRAIGAFEENFVKKRQQVDPAQIELQLKALDGEKGSILNSIWEFTKAAASSVGAIILKLLSDTRVQAAIVTAVIIMLL